MGKFLCFFGLHTWITKKQYPQTSYCKYCGKTLDERNGYAKD